MIWTTCKAALALGAVLAVSGAAGADDRDTLRTAGGGPSTTMTLGGKGTAEQAATEDNELARGYRHYGGYRGWGGGYGGYRGYYGGGYYTGYRSYNVGYYRPAYYYPPRVYYPTYPVYPTYYNGCSTGTGFTLGIGGNSAPTVTLSSGLSRPVPQPMAQPTAPGDGTFRYDGGPANPVPMPKADPQQIPPAGTSSAATDLPVSLKPKTTTSPYKYKAYGEK